jgi:hypothetical protein
VGTITKFSSSRELRAQGPCNPVTLCRDLRIGTGFPLLRYGGPVAWVKYSDSPSCLERETETQAYVYETLNQQPALLEFLRVSEVLRLIEIDDLPYVLVVMEYVHGDTVRQCLKKEDTEERRDRFRG